MDEAVGIAGKAMLRVRADLFRKYREGKAKGWDIDHTIQEYEAAQSEEESNAETSAPAPGPSSPAETSSATPPS